MEYHATTLIMVLFALACFIIGFSKAGFGGAMGFLATPLLALALPVQMVVGLMLPVLMIGDAFTLAAYWRRWDLSKIWLLLAGATAGVMLATLVLVNTPPDTLKKGLAVMVLLFVLYRLLEQRILSRAVYRGRPWHGLLAGGVAGFTSALANAGGPPITIYLLLQSLQPVTFIATSALFFGVLNFIKLPFFLSSGIIPFELLGELIWLTVFVPLGVFIGKRVSRSLNKTVFNWTIVGLLLISAVLLLV